MLLVVDNQFFKMESLVSYGSDDEQELDNSQSTMGRTRDGYREREREHEDNYETVGMDMSDEESNNNSSPHRNDDKRSKNNRFGRSQESSTSTRTRERSRSRERNDRYGNKTRDDNQYGRKSYDDYRRRSKTPHDSKTSYYDNRPFQNRESKSKDMNRGGDYANEYDRQRDSSYGYGYGYGYGYDTLRNRDRRRDDNRKEKRRSDSKERINTDKDRNYRKRTRSPPPRYVRNRSRSHERRDESKVRDQKDRSKSRDRKDRSRSHDRKERSISYDRKDRSRSRERKERSRSREQRKERSKSREQRKERSRSRERNERSRSPQRYKAGGNTRYDRTSNKLAVLEKLGIEIKTPDCQFVTPQMLMQKSMNDKIEEVKNATGIELPKYYNPAVMNPSRYAEQIQKRRLLWGNKNKINMTAPAPGTGTGTGIVELDQQKLTISSTSSTMSGIGGIRSTISSSSSTSSSTNTSANTPIPKIWQQTKFVHDSDGKVASKFKRLMGIKDDSTVVPKELTNVETLKKQEEMFHSMEAQYEVARAATHTMRGVGLGFGAFTGNFPR